MKFTQYPLIDTLIDQLKTRVQAELGEKLTGLYLYGSATAGDFDAQLSDIDLMAVVKSEISHGDFAHLKKMHDQLAAEYPDWKDRIEVVYVTVDSVKNFKNVKSESLLICPGDPLHVKEFGIEWLINLYVIRQNGISVLGPDAKTLIPDISLAEYKEAIKHKAISWQDVLDEYTPLSTRGSVAYAIFTLCRAMYSYEHGEQASKIQSAQWVISQFPEWKEVINNAIEWRRVQWQDPQEVVGTDLPSCLDFLNFAINKVIK